MGVKGKVGMCLCVCLRGEGGGVGGGHNEDIAIGKKMQIKRKKVNSLEKNFSFDVCLFY